MNWELILWLTGIMLFSYWFNYVMGSPLADPPNKPDVKAILFDVPNYLAVRRLHNVGALPKFMDQLLDELAVTSDPRSRNGLKTDNKLNTYLAGREFFTWERIILCPICFHFWLSLTFAVILLSFDLMNARQDYLLGCFTYLINHLIIRKIT